MKILDALWYQHYQIVFTIIVIIMVAVVEELLIFLDWICCFQMKDYFLLRQILIESSGLRVSPQNFKATFFSKLVVFYLEQCTIIFLRTPEGITVSPSNLYSLWSVIIIIIPWIWNILDKFSLRIHENSVMQILLSLFYIWGTKAKDHRWLGPWESTKQWRQN